MMSCLRTTLDLPDDLHRIATGLARHSGRSLGQTVADLMRLGLEATAAPSHRIAEPALPYRISPVTGLPVLRSARPVTDDDVRTLEDAP